MAEPDDFKSSDWEDDVVDSPWDKYRVRVEDFTQAHFEQFPVWEYVDAVGSWEEQTELRPAALVEGKLPAARNPILIKARFYTNDGRTLDGAITEEHAISLTINFQGHELIFFPDVPDMTAHQLQTVLNATGEWLDIFPLRYETGVLTEDGSPIEGRFALGHPL